jgi:endoglucanase Acf2
MAVPHQQKTLKNLQIKEISQETIKGIIYGYEGEILTMEDSMKVITWYSSQPIDEDKIPAVRKALQEDAGFKPDYGRDPYMMGQELAKAARLALIADQLKEDQIAKDFRERIKTILVMWFKGKNPDQLQYDRTHGGLCSKNGLAQEGRL